MELDGKPVTAVNYIKLYINLDKIVTVGPNNDKVYFVMNPNYKSDTSLRLAPKSPRNTQPIVRVDTLNNNWAVKFDSVKLMLEDLGIKSTGATGMVKRYMNPTKLYKKQYEFYYLSEYKGVINEYYTSDSQS